MSCREIVAVYSKDHTEPINVLCGYNIEYGMLNLVADMKCH
jgi:hypothetical protein